MKRIKRWINEHPYVVLLIAQLLMMTYFNITLSLQIMRLTKQLKGLVTLLQPEIQMWYY